MDYLGNRTNPSKFADRFLGKLKVGNELHIQTSAGFGNGTIVDIGSDYIEMKWKDRKGVHHAVMNLNNVDILSIAWHEKEPRLRDRKVPKGVHVYDDVTEGHQR